MFSRFFRLSRLLKVINYTTPKSWFQFYESFCSIYVDALLWPVLLQVPWQFSPLDQKKILCIVLRMQSYDEGVKCFNYDNSLYLSKSSVISYIRPLHIFSSISIVITDCDIETDKIILLEGWLKETHSVLNEIHFVKLGWKNDLEKSEKFSRKRSFSENVQVL